VSVLWAVTAFSAARVAAVLAINPAAIDHAVARGADNGNVAHDPHGGLHAILHSRPSRRDLDQYRAGRDTMFAEVAKAIGGNVLVVE